jgi:hypothetical protein
MAIRNSLIYKNSNDIACKGCPVIMPGRTGDQCPYPPHRVNPSETVCPFGIVKPDLTYNRR